MGTEERLPFPLLNIGNKNVPMLEVDISKIQSTLFQLVHILLSEFNGSGQHVNAHGTSRLIGNTIRAE